jgi:hypothetical protein
LEAELKRILQLVASVSDKDAARALVREDRDRRILVVRAKYLKRKATESAHTLRGPEIASWRQILLPMGLVADAE